MAEARDDLRIGLVQMRSGVEIAANIAVAEDLVSQAAGAGAELIVTPEATNIVQRDDKALLGALSRGADEESIAAFADMARRHQCWLLVGSLMVSAPDGRAANRSHLFAPDGVLAAYYDKIHLFDVRLGEGEQYRESRAIAPGDAARLAQTPWGPIGLTICYDLRFPQLYRALAAAGARILTVPAAFTRPTGEAHWETLLRARAIECGAFVVAPAQGGRHDDGRATWGHSTVIDPWGAVVARLENDEPGVLMADLDLSQVAEARGRIPALQHDRPFAAP